MKRRIFLTSIAGLPFALIGRSSGAQGALLDVGCTPFTLQGIQQCQAGIASEILDVSASDTQHASEWCWAACIEAVFAYYDHPVSQERIVKESWGAIVNMPGSPERILSALNRSWKDDDGDSFRVRSSVVGTNAVTAAQDLGANHPLIIGTLGHAMVLTSLQYVRGFAGQGQVNLAIVRDPWPYNPRRRSLSPQEWYNINFAARIRVEDI